MSSGPTGLTGEPRSLRALLPALQPDDSREVSNIGAESSARKRETTTVACDACRKRKSKCSGERPACSRCVALGTYCVYETRATETKTQALKRKYKDLEEQKSTFEQIYEILQFRTENEANHVLARIRSGSDPESILRLIRNGDLLLQLSLEPETRTRYEFPYISDMPSFLMTPQNPYLSSMIFESTLVPSFSQGEGPSNSASGKYGSPFLKPYQAAEIADPLLSEVVPSRWTTVSSDNALLRRLLNAYFLHQYPTYPAFQKDYFLQDMVSGRQRFCCPLLVNAILAEACHICRSIPDRAKFWVPQTLGYQFLAEAKRQWEIEAEGSKLTHIQAAIILHVRCNVDGMDRIGDAFLLQAIAMAHDLAIFDPPADDDPGTQSKARAFTAWALFNWQSQQRYYFFRPPLLRNPPQTPLPRPSLEPAWFGEFRIKYPSDPAVYHTHFGLLFKAVAGLRVIMNDISAASFSPPISHGSRKNITWGQVLAFHRRLEQWYQALPGPLQPKNVVLPSQLRIHLEYFGCLIALFQSQIDGAPPGETSAVTVGASHVTPKQLVSRAKILQETVVRLYYLRHSLEIYDPFVMEYLMSVGVSAIESINKQPKHGEIVLREFDALRSTLLLCAQGMHSQSQNFHVAALGYRILRDRMRPEDVALLKKYVVLRGTEEGEEKEEPIIAQHAQSQWPIPIIKINEDPRTASLQHLIEEYENISLGSSSESSHENTSPTEPSSKSPSRSEVVMSAKGKLPQYGSE